MRRMLLILLKILLSIICLLLISALALYFYAVREAGTPPTDQELAKYQHLPYFQNGRFTAWQDLPYEPEKTVGKGWFGQPNSPNKPPKPFPMVMLNKNDFAAKPSEDFVYYWLGHSSAIMELAGTRFIVDPVFGRASPIPFLMPRFQVPPLARSELPALDFVLITHDHYDHLEAATIRHFAKNPPHFIVPLGLGSRLKSFGIPAEKITEIGWGDTTEFGNLSISAEPDLHYSQRLLKDRNRTLWAAYVVAHKSEKNDKRVQIFIAGDGGYSEHFRKIGEKYQHFDAALIEIDAGNPGWKNTHMLPEAAVQAAKDINTDLMLPVHWGAYDLALHPWGESIEKTIQAATEQNINLQIPQMGEKFKLGDVKKNKWW
ncbi:MAG: MBL fold metallo-hydrolase [Cardiobacteriaceae bacterium]|nr:MBL fold metallo-hydrolase [Cardiobacteriaceae bacterium]